MTLKSSNPAVVPATNIAVAAVEMMTATNAAKAKPKSTGGM